MPTEPLSVEQCDRDAAASVVDFHGRQIEVDYEIRQGTRDDHPFVQTFARHRLAALEARTPVVDDEMVESELLGMQLEPTQETLGLIAYAIIEGSAGIRAADHAREFVTANWEDAVRSARNAITAIRATTTIQADQVNERAEIVAWLRATSVACRDGTEWCLAESAALDHAADAIERGEHIARPFPTPAESDITGE